MDHTSALNGLLFPGSVADRLAVGHQIVEQISGKAVHDTAFRQDLQLLRQYAEAVNDQMRSMELDPLCTLCSSKPGGGCCSLYMANETDAVQISMNLLSGVDVKVVRDDGTECCFLGERGCLFLFKPMFCLNYICDNIKDTVAPVQLEQLELLTGRLLGKQYEVEQRIVEFFLNDGNRSLE